MDKISELKLTVVELATELHKAKLPDVCCPYRYFGNPDNVELDCNSTTCILCKADYFLRYQGKMTQYVNQQFNIEDPKTELAKTLAKILVSTLEDNEALEKAMEGYDTSSYLAGFNYAVDKVRGFLNQVD